MNCENLAICQFKFCAKCPMNKTKWMWISKGHTVSVQMRKWMFESNV